jgi:hypothetical protein
MPSAAGNLESRLFRQYWDDGLLDLFAGIGVAGIAAFWALDLVALGAVAPAVLATFWVPVHRALVEPRIGHVEFSDARANRNVRLGVGSALIGGAMLVGVIGLTLTARSRSLSALSLIAPGLPAFLLALLAVFVGWGLGLLRFLVYAGVLCMGGIGVVLVDARPEIAMAAGGLVMLLSGGWRMARFLRLPVVEAPE